MGQNFLLVENNRDIQCLYMQQLITLCCRGNNQTDYIKQHFIKQTVLFIHELSHVFLTLCKRAVIFHQAPTLQPSSDVCVQFPSLEPPLTMIPAESCLQPTNIKTPLAEFHMGK
jgi:hypothetical protein